MPGGRGVRKMRWRASGRGKRGGLRIIYYWAVAEDTCYMLYVYTKSEREDLTQKQIRQLASAVDREFK